MPDCSSSSVLKMPKPYLTTMRSGMPSALMSPQLSEARYSLEKIAST